MNENRRPLVMLHGAIGSAAQLRPLEEELGSYFEILNFELPGHGVRSMEECEFNIPAFADDVARRLRSGNITDAIFFGYSMGGYVAMYLARNYPELVGGVITLATKFDWDMAGASKESGMLDPDLISEKFPGFAAELKLRHQPGDWKVVLNKTKDMIMELGRANTLQLEDYNNIKQPCIVILGDRDKMVGLEETVAVYKKLTGGQMCILPGTPHPFEKVDIKLLYFHIINFSDRLT